MTSITLAQLEEISYRYPNQNCGIMGATLEISGGRLVGLIGSNGSGKSTLLKMLSGNLSVSQGKLKLFGKPARDHRSRELRKRVAYVSQDPALDPEMKVSESFNYFWALYQLPASERKAEIGYLKSSFELNDIFNQRIAHLSGGQRQRVHLAIALLSRAELLLLDEPMTGLDAHARERFWRYLRSNLSPARSAIIATHELEEATQYLDQVVFLSHGKIIAFDSPKVLCSARESTSQKQHQARTLKTVYEEMTGQVFQPKQPCPQTWRPGHGNIQRKSHR